MIELLLKAENALSLGMLDQAERVYWQAVEHDARNAIAIVGLSRVALERGDEWTAMDFAARALAVDPENATARRLIVRLTEVIQRRGDGPHGMPARPAVHPVTGDPETDAAIASVIAAAPAIDVAPEPAAAPEPAMAVAAPAPAPAASASRKRGFLARLLRRS